MEKLHSKKTYAETVSPAKSRPPLQTKTTDKQPGHDLNKTLIVTNTSNFSNSVAIKREFAKIFPLKRLIYAFTTVRGNIHPEFLTETEATEVFEKWEPTFLGNQRKIRRASEIEKPSTTVIVKRVPTDIDDSEIALSIQNNHSFDDVKVARFNKHDQTKLETVKINFKTVNDVEKALNEGLFIDSLFYKPTRFQQRTLTIIRCFNCQNVDTLA